MELVRVEVIMNEMKMGILKNALQKYHITGMTVYMAMGCGVQYGTPEYKDEDTSEIDLLEKTVVMMVLPREHVDNLIDMLKKELYTGHIGDGKIFVSPIYNAYRIRTGEDGYEAIAHSDY